MTRDQLAAAHATAIRKHYRKLEDHPGRVHTELLDDLAHIADEHAADRVAADRVTPPASEPERPAALAWERPTTESNKERDTHYSTESDKSDTATRRRTARATP